ncbi:MAG: MGDG synthase family glycosyltransferase [Candidatus Dormibacteria bacterium]
MPAPGVPTGTAEVLILYSDTGGGHRASGQALANAFAARQQALTTALEDPFDDRSSRLVDRITDLYSPLIRRAPRAWGAVYHASNSRAFLTGVFGTLGRLVDAHLDQLLDQYRPELVVSVHPLLNHLAARRLRLRHPRPPLATVITDLVSFHRGWVCPQVNLLVAPTREAAAVCTRHGFPRARLHTIGLPVDPRFAGPPSDTARREARLALGLDPDRFTVMLTGGGEGAGKLARYVRVFAESRFPLQLVVVTGRNQALFNQLRDHPRLPGRCFGFVDNMPELMSVCDAAVCKAGPGTIAESLIMGLPLALTSYLPGQEAGNVNFVRTHGAGDYVPRPDDALRLVAGWMDTVGRPSAAYGQARQNALAAARPRAAAEIADLLSELIPAGAVD